MVKSVWDELSPSILVNAWNKIKKWGDADFTDEDDIPLATLIRTNEIYNNALKET